MKVLTAQEARWLDQNNVGKIIVEGFNQAVRRAVAKGETQILFSEISDCPKFQEIVSNGRKKGIFILPSGDNGYPTLASNTIKEIVYNSGYGLERRPLDKKLPFEDVIIHWRE